MFSAHKVSPMITQKIQSKQETASLSTPDEQVAITSSKVSAKTLMQSRVLVITVISNNG